MEYVIAVAVIVVVGVAVVGLTRHGVRRVTVYEFERGLKYTKGRLNVVLPPGQYWYWLWHTTVRKVDVRPRFASVPGQEVLSSDGVTLKVSLAANYEVVNPDTAVNRVRDFQETLYTELQLALRQIIGSTDIDSLLARRDEISKKLAEMTQGKAEGIGLRLISVSVKDIMFPGPLKEMFAQVVGARKEGLAALQKARGETAALRHLANAARMLESNPTLMQLRLVQALGSSSGGTLVLGLPDHTAAIPIKSPVTPARKTRPRPPGKSQ